MATVKPVSMSLRPFQVAHLCFEVGGILGNSKATLGASVDAFDFDRFYKTLRNSPTNSGDHSRLKYDFKEIQDHVKSFELTALRAEASKAVLRKAINARQNAYYAKYGHQTAIINEMHQILFARSRATPSRRGWQNSANWPTNRQVNSRQNIRRTTERA